MQNYAQQPPGYQRPGSTTSFAAQPAPPPAYAAPQGYQSAVPQGQGQWAPPANNQQWNQTQQVVGGYNPSTYGAMPGGWSQGQQAPNQTSTTYPSQQQDRPPPPPPKPSGYPAPSQHQQAPQGWGQQQQQQNTGFGQQGYPNQAPQESYNTAVPPPPSQTPGGSYFPPAQTPHQQGRPGSLYGADQIGTYTTPSSAVPQAPPSTVFSPNEQQPAYIPPSLTGQGTQSYIPANTNPMPGVYVPPPPDLPAWQQAQHAPLQGGKKFKYTKPTVDPSFYAQGYQGNGPAQQQGVFAQGPGQQYGQGQFPQAQAQQQGQNGQGLPQHNQYAQGGQPQSHVPQPTPPPYCQMPAGQQSQSPQQFHQASSQWNPPPADQAFGQQQQNVPAPYTAQQPAQQQAWQPGHQAQASIAGQQYSQGYDQGIQAPKPMGGHTGTTPPGFVNQPSPQSQPVSPMQHRQSTSFGSASTQLGTGRTDSVSSIALGAIHAQRAGNQTQSPKTVAPKLTTGRPPRDDTTKFSALGGGGPSDWEHFGGAEEVDDEEMFAAKKDEPAQLDSVELPAQVPTPPPTQDDWPSPPSQPAPLNFQTGDDYQPTPPPQSISTPTQHPAFQPPSNAFSVGAAPLPAQQPQQGFVMGGPSVAPLNVAHSSRPAQTPPAQQHFSMGGGGWEPPKQGTPAQQQHQLPPSTEQGFVTNDGAWAAQQSQQPSGHAQYPHNRGWQAPAQMLAAPDAQSGQAHVAELKAKDDAYELLRASSDKDKTDLRTELESLNVIINTVKSHAEAERNVLNEQLDAMQVAADQAKVNADALNKEKDATIERLKEDAEGRHESIKERDGKITDLGKQLKEIDSTIEDLKQQLEAEKAKEAPKPTAVDLIPEIDPWYAGSLERYVAMLRSEAFEPLVEDKIKIFTSFLRAESGIRGLEYYNSLPSAPAVQQPVEPQVKQPAALVGGSANTSTSRNDLNVQVPQDSAHDGFQYSPGGRPMLQRQATLKSEEVIPTRQSFGAVGEPLGHFSTVLTPTSSQEDESNQTPTPVQSPPEEQPQPQYKAYMPPGVTQSDSAQSLHRQPISFASTPPVAPLQTPGPAKGHGEIFFGAPGSQTSTKPASKPATKGSNTSEVPVPAPLFTPQPPAAATPAPVQKKDSIGVLASLIPAQTASPQPNAQLEDIRKKMSEPSDLSFAQDLTTKWDKAAALARKKNDDARRKRQEESEAHTDELFNDNEISYADIGDIEDEFKEKERKTKAQEDREEYKLYVEEVFDKVYDGLQSQIQGLMDLYVQAEKLLHTSASGLESLKDGTAVTTEESLKLLGQLHEQIEARHERVVLAVAERDKRYKKTEVQPLYAAGKIAKMKAVEKHFENAEKQAMFRAKHEKAERIGDLVHLAEEVVVGAVGAEQGEIDRIKAAIRNSADKSDEALLTRARSTLLALKSASKSLLALFNALEIDLNTAVLDADIAQARAENATPERIQELEKEKAAGEETLKLEFERRVGVIDQDREAVDALVAEKGGKVVLEEEDEKKKRMNRALEEAKRRNGDL